MVNGNGNNEIDNGQLMGGIFDGMDSSDPNEINDNAQANMSIMPFKMGVLAMPMMCITPAEILQLVSGMFSGDDADANTDGNATEQMIMSMMKEQMMNMMPSDGDSSSEMENMTDSELQHALVMVVCFPTMDEKMMGGMRGGAG
jgi:hypothetical protein